MIMMYKLILTVAIGLVSYCSPQNNSFTPPKWEGHWESYSATDPNVKVASVDFIKLKGKEYSYKLWIKPENNGLGESCPEKTFEGTATYNGVNGLNSNIQSFGFVYYQEDGLISLYHDYSNQEIVDMGMCFNAEKMKKIN